MELAVALVQVEAQELQDRLEHLDQEQVEVVVLQEQQLVILELQQTISILVR